MNTPAVDDDWPGYSEWSESLESPEGDVENFEIRNGQVHYKGAGLQLRPTVDGIEV